MRSGSTREDDEKLKMLGGSALDPMARSIPFRKVVRTTHLNYPSSKDHVIFGGKPPPRRFCNTVSRKVDHLQVEVVDEERC